jgi:hypothetical protein
MPWAQLISLFRVNIKRCLIPRRVVRYVMPDCAVPNLSLEALHNVQCTCGRYLASVPQPTHPVLDGNARSFFNQNWTGFSQITLAMITLLVPAH